MYSPSTFMLIDDLSPTEILTLIMLYDEAETGAYLKVTVKRSTQINSMRSFFFISPYKLL